MAGTRTIGLSLLLIAGAACASRTGTTTPKPVRSERGPKASIHASYSGGIAYRWVNASFGTEQNAYAIVGHLGGDGIIRIIYPESPTASSRVWAKRLKTKAIQSRFDGAPAFYSLGRTPFRTTGAMMDSYDGRGHGFVFIIATRGPMNLYAASDGYEWDEMNVVDYLRVADPRDAVRELAEQLAAGMDYTLKFANSYSTQSFASYAALAEDCAWLSSLGYGFASGFWGSWGPRLMLGRSAFYHYSGLRSGCYPSYAYSGARYLTDYRYAGLPWNRIDVIPRRPTAEPAPPVTPTLTRPNYRSPDDFSRRREVRSAFERTVSPNGPRSQRWRNDGDEFVRSRPHERPTTIRGNSDPGVRSDPRGSDSPRSASGGSTAGSSRAGPSSSAPASSRPAPATTSATSTTTTTTKKHQ
jgi:hypothetical protein